MANSVINTTRYAKRAQENLRTNLVMEQLCSSQFRADLRPGKTIDFPERSQTRLQNYSYSTDLTIDPYQEVSSSYSIDQVKAVTANIDPLQVLTGFDLDPEGGLSDDMGYQMSRNIDQYAITTGLSGSFSTVAAGAVGAGNQAELFNALFARLTTQRARQGVRYGVVPPELAAVIANSNTANGFSLADAALKNGYAGDNAQGFRIYVSQETPYTVSLTLSVLPTVGETITLKGYTWTYVANGTATDPGDISIGTGGAALADTQASTRAAINGTGTPGASNYIDLPTNSRRDLANAQVSCSAFSGDVASITSFGSLMPSESFTSGSNVFGTNVGQALFGVQGVIDLTVQAAPRIIVTQPEANISQNLIGVTQFGAGVFSLDQPSLLKLTFNT